MQRAGGGGSVAEHGPRELVGERVPALDPLVLVLQAIKPVLQALALGIDAQNHAACRGEPRGSRDTVTSDSQGFSGTSTPWHPSQTLCSKARLSSLPTRSEGGPWSDCHTLGAPPLHSPNQGPGILLFLYPGPEQYLGGSTVACVGARAAPLCTATKPTRNLGPQGLRVQPEGLTIITSYPCSTTDCCVTQPGLFPSLGLFLCHMGSGWIMSMAPTSPTGQEGGTVA